MITSVPIQLGPLVTQRKVTELEFHTFCKEHPDLRIEQDVEGKLIIMAPIADLGGEREGIAFGELYFWWKSNKISGKCHSPFTGFKLPDGSTRSADGTWTSAERMSVLTPEQRNTFAPLVPDFVMEVRSKTDSLKVLKSKMKDTWMKNGVRLGWLIDPLKQKAYVYREDKSVETIEDFEGFLDGEAICPDFQLDLTLFLK